jgi:hypothetical protein
MMRDSRSSRSLLFGVVYSSVRRRTACRSNRYVLVHIKRSQDTIVPTSAAFDFVRITIEIALDLRLFLIISMLILLSIAASTAKIAAERQRSDRRSCPQIHTNPFYFVHLHSSSIVWRLLPAKPYRDKPNTHNHSHRIREMRICVRKF